MCLTVLYYSVNKLHHSHIRPGKSLPAAATVYPKIDTICSITIYRMIKF